MIYFLWHKHMLEMPLNGLHLPTLLSKRTCLGSQVVLERWTYLVMLYPVAQSLLTPNESGMGTWSKLSSSVPTLGIWNWNPDRHLWGTAMCSQLKMNFLNTGNLLGKRNWEKAIRGGSRIHATVVTSMDWGWLSVLPFSVKWKQTDQWWGYVVV